MTRFILALVCVASAALGSRSEAEPRFPAAQSVIPFEVYKGHVYVSAYVNGKGPYRFVFDTGASGMGRADKRLAAELSLPILRQDLNSDGVNTSRIDIVAAESLRLGSTEKRRVELASRDYNQHRKPGEAPVMGIIGRDFFHDQLLTIDYPKRRLTLGPGRLSKAERGVVSYGPSFTIPVCVRSGCYDGEVDTGSSQSLVVTKSVLPRISASAPIPAGSGTSANTVYKLYEMIMNEPVKVSGVTVQHQKVIYAEPSADKINIGSDFLKDYVLTIDQRHKLLKISRPRR